MSTQLFSLLIIINVLAHDKIHKTHDCIHDKIEHQITQQFVQYNNHPLNSKRKLLESTSKYKPIRIRPYYDPLLINKHILSDDKISYIKSLVSASILYLEQFVKVIPITGPLLIERCQRIWHYDNFVYNACPISDYTQELKCQYVTIPDTHIAESWYYDPNTFKSYKYKPSGQGITDADLIIYVSQSDGKCDINGKTLAWASICNLDQYGRPIAGTINFCPQALDNNYWKFDVSVTLHEIMHILIMSKNLFPYFYNRETKQFYGKDDVIKDDIYIITDIVKYITQYHFGCNTLIGAPLENTGDIGTIGSHWESKYLQSELMCGTMYSAVLYLSYFTLALMEDSGWYEINYEYSDYFTWGYQLGCEFFQNDCINKQNSNSNFEQYWCTSSNENGCSYDYSTVAQCLNQKIGIDTLPSQFKYYIDPLFSGPQSHDYCAFKIPQINNNYEQTCWDINMNNMYTQSTQYEGIIFGANARCVEVKYGEKYNGYCFKHECIQWNEIYKHFNGVKITVNDGSINDEEIIICYRNEMLTWKESKSYSADIKCPNIDTICGRTSKPFNCIWGKWSDILNKCICNVGYIGNDCSIQDINRLASEVVISSTQIIPILPHIYYKNGICITNSSNAILNGFYLYDDDYENIPSYHSFDYDNDNNNINNIRYMYYMRFYSQWNIGIYKGDLSIYSFCRQSLGTGINQIINIQDCTLWAIWNDNNGWIYDANMNVFYCTYTQTIKQTISPTHTYTTSSIPTVNPTKNPTIYPTYNPTIYPTNTPNISPTNDPNISPTFDPTMDPSDFPTDIPTMDPSNIPSLSPVIQQIYYTTLNPTLNPTIEPTMEPSAEPTLEPIYNINPTLNPTINPTTDDDDNDDNSSSGSSGSSSIYPSKSPIIFSRKKGVANEVENIATYNPIDDVIINTQIVTLDINNFENVNVNVNVNRYNHHNSLIIGIITFLVIFVFIICVILFRHVYYKCNCNRFKRKRFSTVDTLYKMRSASVDVNNSVVIDNDTGIQMESMLELTHTNHENISEIIKTNSV